jgi:hypothetical protein
MLNQALLNQGDRAYDDKNWKFACVQYDSYFKRAYPEGGEREFSPQDTKVLLKYARAVFEKAKSEATENKYDEEELLTAAEYALTCRERFAILAGGTATTEQIIDTSELLGEIARANNQFKQSADDFLVAYDEAVRAGRDWRTRLGLLYNVVIGLDMAEKPTDAIAHLNQCIAIADEELGKADVKDEDKNDLNEFKASFVEKMTALQGDEREQLANRDILNTEEEEQQEAVEGGENEEAGDGEDTEEEEEEEEEEDRETPPDITVSRKEE